MYITHSEQILVEHWSFDKRGAGKEAINNAQYQIMPSINISSSDRQYEDQVSSIASINQG